MKPVERGLSCQLPLSFGRAFAFSSDVVGARRYVYGLKSGSHMASRYYVGLASDVASRLADHNAGRCRHIAPDRPWQLQLVIEFGDERTAVRFEQYLKFGSGRAFAKRHFE